MNTNGEPKAGVTVGFAGLALSAFFMLGVHIVGSGQIDPVDSTLSALVFVDGYGWMFGAGVLGMAAGAAGLALTLPTRPVRSTLWLVAFCCVLVAVFPTNQSGPMTASAEIHRYAAGVAFVIVPVAALLVARHLDPAGRRGLMTTVAGTAALLVVFLASHFGLMPEPMQDMRGVFQRMMFVLQLVVLTQLLRAGARSAPARAPHPARVADPLGALAADRRRPVAA